jgi:hypothetical protein
VGARTPEAEPTSVGGGSVTLVEVVLGPWGHTAGLIGAPAGSFRTRGGASRVGSRGPNAVVGRSLIGGQDGV